MVKPRSILLYPVYTNLERFVKETIADSFTPTVYCFDQKMPVHCLLTVKKMTTENKSKGLILIRV